METGEALDPVQDHVTAANVYLGAEPVVAALEAGCQVIVTGRVTDTGITLAPMLHEFGWQSDDWDRLAAGIVAGHIIECGTQSTGGNLTDWEEVPNLAKIGFPIIEMGDDGVFEVTKHEGTGGVVNEKSVKEQLVYEMGDPAEYISPDGVAFFDTIRVEEAGGDRVKISGVRGGPAPAHVQGLHGLRRRLEGARPPAGLWPRCRGQVRGGGGDLLAAPGPRVRGEAHLGGGHGLDLVADPEHRPAR